MPFDLSAAFTRVMQNAIDVGGNPYLIRFSDRVSDIQAYTGTELNYCKERLRKLLSKRNMALDRIASIEFVSELGEAHFFILAKRAGVALNKISEERSRKTPDFRVVPNSDTCFEVKTPSIADGEFAMCKTLAESLDGQIVLEDQIKAGQRVAIVEQELAPYGHESRGKHITHSIDVLQKKIQGNLKRDQFNNGSTYLVCSLLLLPPYDRKSNGILRPVYQSSDDNKHNISGHLWMIAFSEPGMLIHSEPEFDGRPGIEGKSDQYGILVGEEYDFVKGIVFVIYDSNGRSRMVCLVRSEDDLNEHLFKLVGDRWNDQYDSNGSMLTY